MLPQGTSPNDDDFFKNATARINAINLCADLQEAVDDIGATIQAELNAIEAQLALLQPILALLQIPTLQEVVTWITNFISAVITPMVKPYTTYITQLEARVQEIAAFLAAIEAAAARLENCTITPPTITIPTIPSPPSS